MFLSAIVIFPVVGVSSNPISDKRVHFPEPEGPIMATFSPDIIAKETFSKIVISPEAVLKRLLTLCIFKIGLSLIFPV